MTLANTCPAIVLCLLVGCASRQATPTLCADAKPSQAAPPASDLRSGAEPLAATGAPIQLDAASIAYRSAPANMPAGVEMAVLEGDPRAQGIFTLRLKAPAGFLLPPHTHPVDERVTVISGTISVGFGDSVERAGARAFEAGSFYVNPPGVAHYVFSDEGAVVQITGVGPWRVEARGSASERSAEQVGGGGVQAGSEGKP